MIEDCKHCGKASEIALIVDDHAELCCVRCKQSVKRNTREAAVLAWNHAQLWTDKTESQFNAIFGGAE